MSKSQGRSQLQRKSVEDDEQRMLDEIEASTARTYQMSLKLHDEVTQQNRYVEDLEEKFVDTKGSLRQETTRITDVRKAGQGLCWMYGVIAAEVVLLFVLLYIGLS